MNENGIERIAKKEEEAEGTQQAKSKCWFGMLILAPGHIDYNISTPFAINRPILTTKKRVSDPRSRWREEEEVEDDQVK